MTTATLSIISAAGVGRLPGAAEALARLFALRQRSPFAWGMHDCCLWAADAVLAQTGVDPARHLRGRYRSALQARRVIAAAGPTLAGLAGAALGEPLRAPMLACAGDVGLVRCATTDAEVDETLAVCLGEWWAAPGGDCMALRPLSAAIAAWKVGCA